MAKIKLTLPGLEIPVDGKQVSFVAPCDCSVADGIQIDGVDYDIVDSVGNTVPFGRGVWRNGAVLSVILDVTNRKAYLQNQNGFTKAETMTTATAKRFGLGVGAVPNDVFGVLSRFQISIGDEYVWRKTGGAYEAVYDSVIEYAETEPATKLFNDTGATTFFVANNWQDVLLGNYEELTIAPANADACKVINGKYFRIKNVVDDPDSPGEVSSSDVYFVPDVKKWVLWNSPNGYATAPVTRYVGARLEYNATSVSYVNSTDPNAYPVDDGFTYTALGQLGNKVQIATGGYKGTGTYSASNPNSLTFDFTPSVVFLWCNMVVNGNKRCAPIVVYPWGANGFYASDLHTDAGSTSAFNLQGVYNAVTLNGNTMSWYSGKDANTQLNAKDISGSNKFTYEYKYLAIG